MHTKPLAAVVTAILAAVGAAGFILTATPSQAAACAGYVGLTFDDGPNASGTTSLLSALTTAGVRATMFNIGQNAANNPTLVQAEVAAGMWVGNHTWTHADMVSLSTAQMDAEITQTQTAIQAGGAPVPKLFRPPYGNTNAALKAEEAKYGLTEVLWDIDTRDWSGVGTADIVAAAANLQNGQVILMHDGFPNTVAAIPQIVADLGSRGLCAGMISTATGRAVAPDGSSTPPTSTPPSGTPPTSTPPSGTPPTSTPPSGTPPTSTPPTSTPPTSTPPTTPSGGCQAAYSLASKWPGGFQASVTVTNAGTAALTGWTVRLTLPAGQTVSSLWNGANTGTTGTVTVKNAAYNGTVAAGASTTFGYTGTGDGSLTPTNVSCTSP